MSEAVSYDTADTSPLTLTLLTFIKFVLAPPQENAIFPELVKIAFRKTVPLASTVKRPLVLWIVAPDPNIKTGRS